MQLVQGRQPILSIHWCGATSGAVLWLEGLTCATLGAWTQMTSAREAPMRPAGQAASFEATLSPGDLCRAMVACQRSLREAGLGLYPQMAMAFLTGLEHCF